MGKRKSTKGRLIKGILSNVSSMYFEAVGKELKSILHEKPGIYALYKGDRLYYTGLSSNLYGRVRWHLKDKHAGKWDNFSIFVLKSPKYSRDIETALINIATPPGNSTKGKIPNQRYLKSLLKKRIRKKKRKLKNRRERKNLELKKLEKNILQIEAAIGRK